MKTILFDSPTAEVISCDRVKFKNAKGTDVKCHGVIVFKNSLDKNYLVGHWSICDYLHAKKKKGEK